jgi:CheY-like chemotaxis protein
MGFFEEIPVSEIEAKKLGQDNSPLRPVVLVVDDEPVVADSIVGVLKISGYAATSAYSAESALAIASTVPPEILITDLSMPGGMNGFELATAMKRKVPDCKILVFSGQAANPDLFLQFPKPAHDFPVLSKPVHPRDLLTRISNMRASHVRNNDQATA